MPEPRIVAARIQGPLVVAGPSHGPARITASSQGGLAILALFHSPPISAVRIREFGPEERMLAVGWPALPGFVANDLLPASTRMSTRTSTARVYRYAHWVDCARHRP